MTWNLHLVGHDVETDIQATVAKFVTDLEAIGHVLDSVVLTTDNGTTDVPTTPPADPTPADAPTPPAAPADATPPPADSTPPSDPPPDPSVAVSDVPTDTPPAPV
jgi:hypothetical protein